MGISRLLARSAVCYFTACALAQQLSYDSTNEFSSYSDSSISRPKTEAASTTGTSPESGRISVREAVGQVCTCSDGELTGRPATTSNSASDVPASVCPTSNTVGASGANSSSSLTSAGENHTSLVGNRISMAYYPSWAVYDRNFFPKDITRPDRFSHILYAFADVLPDGEVILADSYADLTVSDNSSSSLGCIKQLQDLKSINPGLKLLLSIGGWSYSSNFAVVASRSSGRETFARTATDLLVTYGFDGLDIDWEYPQDRTQGNDFVGLLNDTRARLNSAASSSSLSAAVSVNPQHNLQLPISDLDKVLDYWILMGYDYSGGFDTNTGHTANVFPSDNKKLTPFNTNDAIQMYKQNGVDPKKIILGMPLYGRDFVGTEGPGQPFSSVSSGSWGDPGVWDYKSLYKNGSTEVTIDGTLLASWSYDNSTRTMISYDTSEVASLKAHYIVEQGLGGAMWWEITGDMPSGSGGSIVDAVIKVFG